MNRDLKTFCSSSEMQRHLLFRSSKEEEVLEKGIPTLGPSHWLLLRPGMPFPNIHTVRSPSPPFLQNLRQISQSSVQFSQTRLSAATTPPLASLWKAE